MKLNKPVFVISKRADSLTEALKKSPQAITVWVRSGKFKDRFPLLRSSITYQTNSAADAGDYKKRFISVILIPGTHTKLSVLKGVSGKEIRQILSYTKKDRLIRTATHDIDCFKSKRTFLSWKRRGKTVYSLINRHGKLFGIIWFNKGVRPLRIYPPGRKKGIARKFSEIVRRDFDGGTRKSVLPKNRKG